MHYMCMIHSLHISIQQVYVLASAELAKAGGLHPAQAGMPTNTYNGSAHSTIYTLYTAHSTTAKTFNSDGVTPIHAAHVNKHAFHGKPPGTHCLSHSQCESQYAAAAIAARTQPVPLSSTSSSTTPTSNAEPQAILVRTFFLGGGGEYLA
jgi:hypothetical protein